MVVTLSEALLVLYPNAKPLKDYVVQDSGSGAVIAYWHPSLGAQPSQAALDAVTVGSVTAFYDDQEPLLRDLRDQAQAGLDAIDTYLAIADSATNVQVRAEVKAIDQRQRKIILALKRLIQKDWR